MVDLLSYYFKPLQTVDSHKVSCLQPMVGSVFTATVVVAVVVDDF